MLSVSENSTFAKYILKMKKKTIAKSFSRDSRENGRICDVRAGPCRTSGALF